MIENRQVRRPAQRLITSINHLQQRPRQLLVLATAVGFPGSFILNWMMPGTGVPALLWEPIAIVGFGLTLICGSVIWAWTRNRVDLSAALDERERQVRDRVYVRSYQVLGAIDTCIVAIVGLTTAFGSPLTIDFFTAVPFIVGNAIYFPALPSLVYAWTERDPLPEHA